MRRWLAPAFVGFVLLSSCGVTAGDSLNPCQENIPAPCGDISHCVLAGDEYLSGNFPSTQTFTIHTATATQVTFSFQFNDRISAGTMLTLTSSEPDCSTPSTYTSTGDLFEDSGASGVLSFPITMTEAGDHLIVFSSDAYCSYDLAYQ
jgi:hypothetical protein